ncbi:MAG: glycosyltransferase family 2 protein [Verrucomicrobia bacterium]|nr:glycosyltransferase family 2 protein [Verrucomicrobiota bacterium]
MTISVVTTLYNSAPYIEEFYRRIVAQIRQLQVDCEIVFVDDGSPDNALEVAINIAQQDSRVLVVELSKNFGHHKAMMTGIAEAHGDLVFLIDVDLEEPPEVLSEFYRLLKEKSVDIVFGIQQERHGTWFQRVSGEAFYHLYNLLSTNVIPRNQLRARLMTRRYVDALLRHKEQLFMIEILCNLTGFKQIAFPMNKTGYKGITSYTLARRIRLFINGITMSSNRPLIYIGYLGAFIVFLAAIYTAFVLVEYLLGVATPDGWTSLIISTWFLGGLTIFSLGIIATYLSVMFEEMKGRPYSIIAKIHGGPDARNPNDSFGG